MLTARPNIQVCPDQALASLCKRRLFRFVQEFWGEIISDEPVWNWHIPYLCEELEKVTSTVIADEPKLYDLICNICPGTTKSTLVSIMLPCWLWVNRPELVVLLNTVSQTNATKFAMKRREILTSPKFQKLFPEVKLRQDAQALYAIKNTLGGEMSQYTTKGRITGDHGHVKIDDDPMSYQDSISEEEAKRCINGYKALSTRNKDARKTVYIQVMQRLSIRDTTQHVLKTLTNFKHIVLPAIANEKVQPPELAEKYVDGFLDPVRLSQDTLEELKKGLAGDEDDPMSESEFNAQFLQDLDMVEGLMYEGSLQIVPFSSVDFSLASEDFCAIDPADDGLDTLGVIYATEVGSKYYIRKVIYNADNVEVNAPRILQLHDRVNPIMTLIETNGLGSVFAKLLKRMGIRGIKPLNNAENKLGRIDSYKWIIQQHIVFDEECDGGNPDYVKFLGHMKKLPKDGNKKMVGAADVVTHFAKGLFKMKRV